MIGGNQAKSTTQMPPATSAPTAAASSNNDGGTSKNNNNNKSTPGGNKKLPRPNPSPKVAPIHTQSQPNPIASSSRLPPANPFPFPDSSAPPPPPPAYGFHMLERRLIALADGSVRSYLALPPNYRDFSPQRRITDSAARYMGFPPNHPEEFRDQRQHWDRPEGSMKRKYPGEEEIDRRDERSEILRQRHQIMQYANPHDHSLMARTSSPYGEDVRAAKQMRIGSSRHESGSQGFKHFQVEQAALKKSFLGYVKRIFDEPSERRKYLENGRKGPLQCLVCGRSSKDVQDTHGLVMHTYDSDDASSLVQHLGLHKALCVLMGWDFSKAPDNSKSYQNLPAEVAAINRDQLIIWPPHVIVHNTSTGKGKDGQMEGFGNKRMENRMRELKLTSGKPKSLYGRDGHLGITLFKFAGDDSGIREAVRMAEYFEKTNRGRKTWARLQPHTPGKDDEKNPSLVEVDERTGEKKRVLYGYLATITDLDKVDPETRKKTTIESLRELTWSK